jgi:protein xylosyltransferase
MYRELLKLESSFINIKLARIRFSTIWGGASLLRMLLQSMTDLLHSQWNWDFVINLSESDFPVKSIEKLEQFVGANAGKNFVKSHGREVQRFIQKQGLDKTFIECDVHMWRVGDRELPSGIQIDGGSDWVGLSRDFVEYVTNPDQDPLIAGLMVLFRHTLLPAESFFHTAIRNSHFCNTYIDNNLHVTNWKRKLGCKCQYKHVVDWCGCSPNDFKSDDWPRLQATEKKQLFFARKFEPIIHQAVILQLEEWLYGPYPENFPNLNSYWQNIYHHMDVNTVTDSTISALAESLIRINAQTSVDKFKYTPVRLLEINNLMQLDSYRGFLIRHQVQLVEDESLVELETWVRVNQTAQVSKTNTLARRITFLEVSTDYDQKEQLGRNYAKILGPNSEPVLIIRVSGSQSENGTNYNLNVVFIDPSGQVADMSELTVDDTSTTSVHHVKSSIDPPLAIGMWSVKILNSKKSPIGLCNFLVTPLKNSNNNNNNLESSTNSDTKDDQPNINISNNNLASKDQELDTLIVNYFLIKESCIIKDSVRTGNLNKSNFLNSTMLYQLKECKTTDWSSLADDPKSDVLLELYKT